MRLTKLKKRKHLRFVIKTQSEIIKRQREELNGLRSHGILPRSTDETVNSKSSQITPILNTESREGGYRENKP